jgi:5'-3' exonuclease
VEQEYEALVLLPRIDPNRIRVAFQKIKHLLTAAEKDRNASR